MPAIDPSAISRMIWLCAAEASAAAIIGTAIVYVLHTRLIALTRWKVVVWVATIFALACVYAASGTIMSLLLDRQLQRRIVGDQYIATIYVHPGVITRLLPLFAILLTWILFVRRRWEFWK
jgi:hypothetical protein